MRITKYLFSSQGVQIEIERVGITSGYTEGGRKLAWVGVRWNGMGSGLDACYVEGVGGGGQSVVPCKARFEDR